LLSQSIVDLTKAVSHPVHCHVYVISLIYLHDPVGRVNHELQEFAESNAACNFTGSHASHAVGDQHPVPDLLEAGFKDSFLDVSAECFQRSLKTQCQVMIFVVFPDMSSMRGGCYLDLHVCGCGFEV